MTSWEEPLKWRFLPTCSPSDILLPASRDLEEDTLQNTRVQHHSARVIKIYSFMHCCLVWKKKSNIITFTLFYFTTVKCKLLFLPLCIDRANSIYYVGADCPNKSIVIMNFPLIFHCWPCSLLWRSL